MLSHIMDIIKSETNGTTYRGQRYVLDNADDRPTIDYVRDDAEWNAVIENVSKKEQESPHDIRPISSYIKNKNSASRFAYFLDGSRHVYRMDDLAFPQNGRLSVYPVLAGQIGVGCLKREGKQMRVARFAREFVIALPKAADADGIPGFAPALAQRLTETLRKMHPNFRIHHVLLYDTSREHQSTTRRELYESRGIALVQKRMQTLEQEFVRDFVRAGQLSPYHMLMKDGSLEYINLQGKKRNGTRGAGLFYRADYKCAVGISKNFNPQICRDYAGKVNPGLIVNLPYGHRTFAVRYKWQDTNFAVWYLRLRERERTTQAFGGIVKVEKILDEEEIDNGMDSEEVDNLSAHIFNERNPVCYGADSRWANHLYPIFLTESYVKSKYLSAGNFLQFF